MISIAAKIAIIAGLKCIVVLNPEYFSIIEIVGLTQFNNSKFKCILAIFVPGVLQMLIAMIIRSQRSFVVANSTLDIQASPNIDLAILKILNFVDSTTLHG